MGYRTWALLVLLSLVSAFTGEDNPILDDGGCVR